MIPQLPEWAERIPDLPRWHEEEWMNLLRKLASPSIVIIRGTGRSGKTALAYTLLERARDQGQTCYLLGGDPGPIEWLTRLDSLEELDSGEGKRTILVDDIGALGITARSPMSSDNKTIQEFSTVISHKEITMIFSVQNLRLLDVLGLMTTQDVQVLTKLSDQWGIIFEREYIRELVDHANDYLTYVMSEFHQLPSTVGYHDSKGLFYNVSSNRPAWNPLPEWYTDRVSRSYRDEDVIKKGGKNGGNKKRKGG